MIDLAQLSEKAALDVNLTGRHNVLDQPER